MPLGYCDPSPGVTVDSAAVGYYCSSSAQAGDLCGPKGDGFAGLCATVSGGLGCFELCPLGDSTYACQSGTCTDVFTDSWKGDIGLCE